MVMIEINTLKCRLKTFCQCSCRNLLGNRLRITIIPVLYKIFIKTWIALWDTTIAFCMLKQKLFQLYLYGNPIGNRGHTIESGCSNNCDRESNFCRKQGYFFPSKCRFSSSNVGLRDRGGGDKLKNNEIWLNFYFFKIDFFLTSPTRCHFTKIERKEYLKLPPICLLTPDDQFFMI